MKLRWWKRDADRASRELPDPLRLRYYAFRHLLIGNNQAMDLISRLEKTADRGGVNLAETKTMVRELVKVTQELAQGLDTMTGGQQARLLEVHRKIAKPLNDVLAQPALRPESPLVMDLKELQFSSVMLTGNKAAALAEARRALGGLALVPPGFVITTRSEQLLLAHNGVEKYIDEVLADLGSRDDQSLTDRTGKIREMILQAAVPEELRSAVIRAAEDLAAKWRGNLALAVRSSAVGEDSNLSFAGQFESVLNVDPAGLVEAYKQVLAGKYSERSLIYLRNHGLAREDAPMAVLCLPLLEPRTAGVLYTADPNRLRPSTMIVSANYGLGPTVVSGMANPDLYYLPYEGSLDRIDQVIADKSVMLKAVAPGELTPVEPDMEMRKAPCLTSGDLEGLRRLGVALSNHFRTALDIEWAILADGTPAVLQARPLTMADADPGPTQILPAGYPEPMIRDGEPASGGVAAGKAFLHEGNPRRDRPPRDSVLVVANAHIDYSIHLGRIRAVVAERGNPAGHLATLLREKKIPAVMGVERARQRIQPGSLITVDGSRGLLISGDHVKDIETPAADPAPFPDPARAWLDPIIKYITPLNLTSLLSMTFHPGSCKTLHDVVRYVHEMSVRAMFETGDSLAKSRSYRTVRLDAGLGVRILIIDLGEGLEERGESTFIKPDQVRSRPFNALYRGMTRPGVRWSGPPPMSARGFAGVLVTAASDPGMGSRLLGGDSYLLVSEDYMNLSARLAYHFAMVDANLAGRDQGNYINFRFKGGGANLERRTRRARFIDGILSAAGFTVTLEQDLVNAWFKERTALETEQALATVGALLGSARQLDMAMESDSTMEWFKQQFMAGNYAFTQN